MPQHGKKDNKFCGMLGGGGDLHGEKEGLCGDRVMYSHWWPFKQKYGV